MRIKEAAIQLDGKVWTGRRHHLVIRSIIDALGADAAPVIGVQGFVTECGKFVEREEAARIAFEAGQTTKLLPTLFSEDLY